MNSGDIGYDQCPACKAFALVSGYGLGYGPGIGAYDVCGSCDYSVKTLDPDLYPDGEA